MLSLDSPRWKEMRHAYGVATDVPGWIRTLRPYSSSSGESEPWFSLWSALAHQGDVFESTYAAVPHIIEVLATNPLAADPSFFHFPAWVEVCRNKAGATVPPDLASAYEAALKRLPTLVAAACTGQSTAGQVACYMAALAAANGQPQMAEVALELTPELSESFLHWHYEQ